VIKKIIKIIPHVGYKEYFVTANWKNLKKDDLKKILDELRVKAVNIISIVYTGNLKKNGIVSDLFSSYPTTAIGDSSSQTLAGSGGIYVYGVQGEEIRIKYIKEKEKTIGTYFYLLGKWKGLYLESPFDQHNPENFESETIRAYEALEKIVVKYGFSFKDAYRFWIYMKNIKDNYAAFNKVRDRYFKKNGISDYPASTGIEADLVSHRRISISLEALRASSRRDIAIQSLKSKLQCEASAYGPKFSRGKVVYFKKDKVKKVYISGTSSVCKDGSSAKNDDYAKNVKFVILCVHHLLVNSGSGLENIVMSRIYAKNVKVRKIFEKVYSKKGWTFPYNFLKTNVCRENLIFEIECIAVGN
jgi:enamine deaminase RidA (YjgF/YER057c/UK114 family)